MKCINFIADTHKMITLKSQCIDFIIDNNISTCMHNLPSELYEAISDTLHKNLLYEMDLAIMPYDNNYPSELQTCEKCKRKAHSISSYVFETLDRDKGVWEPHHMCMWCYDLKDCGWCGHSYMPRDIYNTEYGPLCIKCNVKDITLQIEYLTDKKFMDFSMVTRCNACNIGLKRKDKPCMFCNFLY